MRSGGSNFPPVPLERSASKLVDMAGAAPLSVLGEVEFEAFVLTKKRGRVYFRVQVVPTLPADWYLSMHEIKALGADILTPNKKISLSALSPPIVLPLYETTYERILPTTGVAVSASVACISAAAQGARLLESHSVSPVKFKVGEKLVPLLELLFESSDKRFGSVVNETDDLIELEQTMRFSVSTIGDASGGMRFETKTAEYDAAPIAAGIRFAADDDGDGDVHFDTTSSCDAHAAEESRPVPLVGHRGSQMLRAYLRAARYRGCSWSRFGRYFRGG